MVYTATESHVCVCVCYRLTVLVISGWLLIDDTDSSISGCVLINNSTESGNCAEDENEEAEPSPAHEPGLNIQTHVT